MRRLPVLALATITALLVVLPAASQTAAQTAALDWRRIGRETLETLQDYLQVDTINPPGNEIRGARFFAERFEAAGIPFEVFESEPGRGNIVARLAGDGSRGGHVVLLNHMDVVPADPRYWSVEPLSGVIRDGRIYGRGVTDMKADAAVQLAAMLALHRAGVPLGRDVMFLGTAAEETGGFEGAGYIVEKRRDLIDGVEFALTEGGSTFRAEGRMVHNIETTQKTPLWLRLKATGVAGHGSRPIADSAANRLVRALDRVRTFRSQMRLVPPVAEALRSSAALETDPGRAAALLAVERSIGDPAFLASIDQRFGPLLRNTISITALTGSNKTNVISPEATAELDCRLLPGENPDLFIATLREVIDDDDVEIETILRFQPSASPRDTALWRAIEEAAREHDANALVVPTVLGGFTDSHFFREAGIVAYGWSPIVGRTGDGPAHGNDERLSVEAVIEAPRMLYDMLVLLAARRPTN